MENPLVSVDRSSCKARQVILLGLALAAFASQPTVANGQQAAPDSVFVGDERSAVLSGVLEYIPMVGFAYAGDWKRGLLPNAFRVASFIGFAATVDFLSPSCSAACTVSGFAMVATSVWAVVGAVNTARDHNKAARVPRSSLSVAPAPFGGLSVGLRLLH